MELRGKRWESGACFANPDGTQQYIVFGSPMHYHDGAEWQAIDNRWQAGVSPWQFEMTACQYKAYVLARFDAGQIIRLEQGGHYVTYQPMALNWTNDLDQIQQIAMPANVQGAVTNGGVDSLCPNGELRWAGGYGTGLDFTYTPSTHFLKKELTVAALARLGTPAQYIIDGGKPVLALSFVFSTDLDLWIDGAKWDKKSQKSSVNNIEFRDTAGVVQWWWRTPYAEDANGERVSGSVQVKKQGSSLYVSVLIPYAWLQSAVYPVRVDPDTYYGATTDGWLQGYTNTNYATAHTTHAYAFYTGPYTVGQNYDSGSWGVARTYLEFDTSVIDDDATITQANLYLTVGSDTSVTDFSVRVHEYNWTSPMDAATHEADYDGMLAATENAVTWKNTADAGFAANTPYASENLRTAYIEKGATKTKYTLVSNRDVAATEPGGREDLSLCHQEHATQAYRPYLSITVAAAGGVPKQYMHYARMRQ